MNAITICVGYDDFLRHTLPRMQSHFESVTVVTSLDDNRTISVGGACHANVRRTDAFYAAGAVFNKGAALDEALRGINGGWVCVLDADIYLPSTMDLAVISRGALYSPFRRLMERPGTIPPDDQWGKLDPGPEYTNNEYAGYFHLFHLDDIGPPPWYEENIWRTAQGCDSMFTNRWRFPKLRLPFEVLHLGTPVVNWKGRVSPQWE